MADFITVFISSTSKDLEKYRAAAEEVIKEFNAVPISMEYFPAADHNPVQECYDRVQQADIFVGLYAHRYGYIPGSDLSYRTAHGEVRQCPGHQSITHLEYHWARERGIPILAFVVDDKVHWPEGHIDQNEPEKSLLAGFKQEVKLHHVVAFFGEAPDELRNHLYQALHFALEQPDFIRRRSGWKLPELSFMLSFFVGREPQRRTLVEYLSSAKPRVRVAIVGAGGLGKTTLAQRVAIDVQHSFPAGVYFLQFNEDHKEIPLDFLGPLARSHPQGRQVASEDLTLQRVHMWLEDAPGQGLHGLVVADDVWDENIIAQLEKLLPNGFSLLVTTRSRQLVNSPEWQRISLDVLSDEESVEYLRQALRVPENIPSALLAPLRDIVKICGGHALTLHLATRACDGDDGIASAREYLERIRSVDNLFDDDSFSLGGSRNTNLEKAFSLSYKRLPDQDQQLFHATGVFAHSDFSAEALLTTWDNRLITGHELRQAEAHMRSALVPAFLTYNEMVRRYRVHQMLQEYAAWLLQQHPDEQDAYRQRFASFYLSESQPDDREQTQHALSGTLDELKDRIIKRGRFRIYWQLVIRPQLAKTFPLLKTDEQFADRLESLVNASILLLLFDYIAGGGTTQQVLAQWQPIVADLMLVGRSRRPSTLGKRARQFVVRRLIPLAINAATKVNNAGEIYHINDVISFFPPDEQRKAAVLALAAHVDAISPDKAHLTPHQAADIILDLARAGQEDLVLAYAATIALLAHMFRDPRETTIALDRLLTTLADEIYPEATIDPNRPTLGLWYQNLLYVFTHAMPYLFDPDYIAAHRDVVKQAITVFLNHTVRLEEKYRGMTRFKTGRVFRNPAGGEFIYGYKLGEEDLGAAKLKAHLDLLIQRQDHEQVQQVIKGISNLVGFGGLPEAGFDALYDAIVHLDGQGYFRAYPDQEDAFWKSVSDNLVKYTSRYKEEHLLPLISRLAESGIHVPPIYCDAIYAAVPPREFDYNFAFHVGRLAIEALTNPNNFVRVKIIQWAFELVANCQDINTFAFEAIKYLSNLLYQGDPLFPEE